MMKFSKIREKVKIYIKQYLSYKKNKDLIYAKFG